MKHLCNTRASSITASDDSDHSFRIARTTRIVKLRQQRQGPPSTNSRNRLVGLIDEALWISATIGAMRVKMDEGAAPSDSIVIDSDK